METIDLLRLEDTPALEFCVQYISQAWNQPVKDTKERFLKCIKGDDRQFCLVAKVNDLPIGMMMNCGRTGLQTDGVYEPWCAGLYVVEAYRRRGIGKRLMQRVLDVARQNGFAKIYLGTDKEFLVKWYMRLGWKTVGNAYDGDHHYSVMEFCL